MRLRARQGADDARRRRGRMYVPLVCECVCRVVLRVLLLEFQKQGVEDGSNVMGDDDSGERDEPRPRSRERRTLCAR